MRWAVVGSVALLLAFVVLGSSTLNPLLVGFVNSRLDDRCSDLTWDYDRSGWTPLQWHCTVHGSGEAEDYDLNWYGRQD